MKTAQKTLAILCLLAATVGLSGCDKPSPAALRIGQSTALDVRDVYGRPAAEWPNSDGSVTWEYPRGPEGVECWMITVTAAGVLQKMEQVLNDEHYAKIEKGLSPDQVRRILGRPSGSQHFPMKQEVVWEWHVASVFPGQKAFFHVHFSENGKEPGQVVGTSRREDSPN